jgi:predicted transcriptional regulator
MHDMTSHSVHVPAGGIMANLTLRGLDGELRKRLERVAQERNQSLNATAISLLREYLGLTAPPIHRSYDDLDHLAGTWSAAEAAEFDRAVEDFEHVEPELWK